MNLSSNPATGVPAHGSSTRKVFALLGTAQSLIASPLFLAEKISGRFEKSQPPSQLRLQFGRSSAQCYSIGAWRENIHDGQEHERSIPGRIQKRKTNHFHRSYLACNTRPVHTVGSYLPRRSQSGMSAFPAKAAATVADRRVRLGQERTLCAAVRCDILQLANTCSQCSWNTSQFHDV